MSAGVSKDSIEIAIIASIASIALCLSTAYVLVVPFFMQPDEIAHADYAFAFFNAGAPFRLHASEPENYVSPQTRYLMQTIDYRRLRYNFAATVGPDRGDAGRRAIDRRAPPRAQHPPADNAKVPYAMETYPPLYYMIVAGAMEAGYALSGRSLVTAFYSGRLINLVYFSLTLCVVYAILRRIVLVRAQRLLLFGAVALFPMSQWLSAYIQPDNQSALFVNLCFLLVLCARSNPETRRYITFLSAALCILAFTKMQYAVVMIVSSMLALWPRKLSAAGASRIDLAVFIAALPGAAVVLARLSVPGGAFHGTSVNHAYDGNGFLAAARLAATNLGDALSQAYLGGATFFSFWLHCGIRGASAFDRNKTVATTLAVLVASGTLIAVGATLGRQYDVLCRLRLVAKRHGRMRALGFLGNDLALTAYVTLSALLFALSTAADGYLALAGRYWYPLLTQTFLIAVTNVGFLAAGRARRHVRTAACASLAALSLVLTPATIYAMRDDFHVSRAGTGSDDRGEITQVQVDRRLVPARQVVLRRGETLRLFGVAMDSANGIAATDIKFRVDGGSRLTARSGLRNERLALLFQDQTLARAGFEATIATGALRLGRHRISILSCEHRKPQGYALAFIDITLALPAVK